MTIDEYLVALGVNLLSCQRKLVEEMMKPENKHLIVIPPHVGRTHVKHMMEYIELMNGKSVVEVERKE